MSVNILVYEHVTAGGMPGEIPAALADAGKAMWRALVDDFAAAGCKVWTTSGERETVPRDGGDMVRIKPASELQPLVQALAQKCDGAIIVAPETGGILAQWVSLLSSWNIPLLNCSPKTIALCGDKWALARHLEKHGVATVPTKKGEAGVLLDAIGQSLQVTAGAYVIKPIDGAGCEQTFVIRSANETHALREMLSGDRWIAQPFVEGEAVSVSFIAHGSVVRPLLAGRQIISGSQELRYDGGHLPLDRKQGERAVWLATQAIRTLKELRGFIGVDLILAENAKDDVVIEINPRVTVSYCGLRHLCATNMPKAMLNADAEIKWRKGSVTFDNAGKVQMEGPR